MPYYLYGVWSTIGLPSFATQEEKNKANQLALSHPSIVRNNLLESYRELYGEAAVEALLGRDLETEDGLHALVVSFEKAWALPGAEFYRQPEIPAPVAGPDEELVRTLWGDFVRKKSPESDKLTRQDVEQIARREAAEVCRGILKALGIIVS